MAAIVLAGTAYAPYLGLPLLSDDYLLLTQGGDLGGALGWRELMADPLYRCRATSIVLAHWVRQIGDLSPAVVRLTSLLLHGLNIVLVFLLGRFGLIGWRVAGVAALVFAVRERPQEAVVWFAALPELLMLVFALLTVHAWLNWMSGARGLWLGLAGVSFVLALGSKESAVAVVPLLVLFGWLYRGRRRRWYVALVPFVLVAAGYTAASFIGAEQNQHYRDGTFSLKAPFVRTLARSAVRGFWVWGTLGVIALVVLRSQRGKMVLGISLGWIVIALTPYSFLTYMPAIPSRHHYFASVGFALLIAAGGLAVWRRRRLRLVAAAAMAAFVIHNTVYLWTYKRQQFAERAAPFEALIKFLKEETRRPVYVECFPVSLDEARRAARLRLGEDPEQLQPLVAGAPAEPVFCYPE